MVTVGADMVDPVQKESNIQWWASTRLRNNMFVKLDHRFPNVRGSKQQAIETITKITTHLANGPWNKSLNFIFPTKYGIPKSLKRLAIGQVNNVTLKPSSLENQLETKSSADCVFLTKMDDIRIILIQWFTHQKTNMDLKHDAFFKGILATPPKATPPRNQALLRDY